MKQRRFNTTGVCIEGMHCMIPPEKLCPGIMQLIDNGDYFTIYAPRRSGKTTLLTSLERHINQGSKYICLYCSLEEAERIADPQRGINTILECIRSSLEDNPVLLSHAMLMRNSHMEDHTLILRNSIKRLCSLLDRPLVILFDEADCLSSEVLSSFLRQIRSGFINRVRAPFPKSIALVGLKNLSKYGTSSGNEEHSEGGASPFNICAASKTFRNLTAEEVSELYQQHTADTGQVFPKEIIDQIMKVTAGQPWLVNALARGIVFDVCQGNYKREITMDVLNTAIRLVINSGGYLGRKLAKYNIAAQIPLSTSF